MFCLLFLFFYLYLCFSVLFMFVVVFWCVLFFDFAVFRRFRPPRERRRCARGCGASPRRPTRWRRTRRPAARRRFFVLFVCNKTSTKQKHTHIYIYIYIYIYI